MIVHFFRKRDIPRIDFYELIDVYFDSLENCTITSNDNEVEIKLSLPYFNFEYRFLVTKRSHILSIYKLNSDYININLLCEVPTMLPQYISRLIFKQINEICERFELAIYFDKLEDIHQFEMFELITALGKERLEYLDNHSEVKKYLLPMNTINEICQYTSMKESLTSSVKEDVIIPLYNVLAEKNTCNVKLSISWKAGTPCIFPPHLDFIQVVEEENFVDIIPIDVFLKYVEKYMNEFDTKNDDVINFRLLCLSEKAAAKARKLVKKMKKSVVSLTNFENINITDLTEK